MKAERSAAQHMETDKQTDRKTSLHTSLTFLLYVTLFPGFFSILSEYFQQVCIHTDRLALPFLVTIELDKEG